MSTHLSEPCCPGWKWVSEKSSSKPQHDHGCYWSEQTSSWERVAIKAIDAAVEWLDKQRAYTRGGE